MARLTAAQRRNLKPSQFAGKGRSFPITDRGHAIAAKADAKTKLENGTMPRAEYDRIVAEANAFLGKTGKSLKEKLGK